MNNVNNIEANPGVHHPRPDSRAPARLLGLLGLLIVVVILQADACSGASTGALPPGPPPTPTPCAIACEPPALPLQGLKSVGADHFSLYYFSPKLSVDTSGSNNTTVVLRSQPTQYGSDTAELISYSVPSGTTASAFLVSWLKQNIDPTKFTTFQQAGVIPGAEIGYVPGVGETFYSVLDVPNAPSTPLYLQVVAAVNSSQAPSDQNAIGIIFVGATALDPTQPDPLHPRRDNSGMFDALLNTLVWL